MRKKTSRRSFGRPYKFANETVISALEASGGILAHAARMLRCDVGTVRSYIAREQAIATALDDIVEERLDIAETVLLKQMANEKSPHTQLNAAIFYLKTKGKERGYTMSTEITGRNGGPVQTQAVAWDLSKLSADEIAELEKHALVTVKKTTGKPAPKH